MMDIDSKNEQHMTTESETAWYDGKPTFKDQVGVYKDGIDWVVGHMREMGLVDEVGRFESKEQAIQVADHYIKDLIDMGLYFEDEINNQEIAEVANLDKGESCYRVDDQFADFVVWKPDFEQKYPL